MKKNIMDLATERVVVLDGGMGTQIFANSPTVEDYGGAALEGCVEILNERRPEWIRRIHANYFDAGADAVETNTFGCNELVLAEFGLEARAEELNIIATKLAREVADSYAGGRYVVGSVGPGTKLLTLLHVNYQTLYKSYLGQMKGLLKGGADVLLIETCQDLGQIKCAVRAAKHAMMETGINRPVWTQITVETTGTLLVGSDVQAALSSIEMLDVQVMGMNCATGPEEMRQHIAYLSNASPMTISCLPNAGLPLNQNGQTVYPLGPDEFARKVSQMVADFGVGIVGGCCGTTPDHIRALKAMVADKQAPVRHPRFERSVASLYSSVPLDLEPKPLYVGERTNANGSKKFRDLLATNDYDGLVSIAKGQLKEGAHVLDVCVAYVSRDEVRDMEEFLKRLVTQVNIPLMIDSTEVPVIERALQLAPGKCIVNSINFEDGDDKARRILTLCKEYGAAVVALTIDEEGMAKSLERKVEIAKRLCKMVTEDFGMSAGDLIIDPLTFTLGSGDEEFRKSAVATLDGIERIKSVCPGVKTILGLSNVSFGLTPYTRQLLNSMMLYHAVKKGLDLAILNASKIIPVAKIADEDRALFEDLLFDRRATGYDPLKRILEKFADSKGAAATSAQARAAMSIEDKLKNDIIDGEKGLIVEDAHEAMKTYKPLDIINNILLEGMKVVGERFGAGEMQLPFVLESAEAMKTAVKTLEPFMEKKEGYSKGRIILATVKGDVHDIGKNLVEIILSNNGYQVVNLGIKQPIESILERYKESGADAIGLSGLLVKSTVIMKENLTYLAEHGFKFPVILGGAALTRAFVEKDCQSGYPGPVFYAEDAFEGLRLMDALRDAQEKQQEATAERIRRKVAELKGGSGPSAHGAAAQAGAPADDTIRVVRKGESKVPLDARGQSSWVRKTETVPTAPFEGTRLVEKCAAELFTFLDDFALIRSRWGFSQGAQSDDEFSAVLKNKAEPLLAQWSEKIIADKLLQPKAVYGYFPAASKGDELLVYEPGTTADIAPAARRIITKFVFPRQESGRRLCIADFFRHEESGVLDVVAAQCVTMGEGATEYATHLYSQQKFSDYFLFHGLTTELTEAFAELLHKHIRTELGVAGKDAVNKRQLFSQGYQGSRYSFGYPACPEMENNKPLLELLDAGRIGVALSESFQMVPEQTTCAVVSWHPQARYFSV